MLNDRKVRVTNYGLLLAMLFALVVSLLFATTVFAQDDLPTDDEVNKIAKQLYCPVCESTPLDVCPTEACRQWRDTIRQLLSEGKSEDEIKKYFETNYGARALDEPPNRIITYGVPVAAFLLGAFLLFRGFKMWLKPVAAEPASPTEEAEVVPQDDYIRRMEEELKKRK